MPNRILIADDDSVARSMVDALLRQWEYEPIGVADGREALEALTVPDGPRLAILDWMMPGYDGPEVCRRLREAEPDRRIYLILLTSLDSKANIVEGLEAGADDYLVKPFDSAELRARVRAGYRVVQLEKELRARVDELEDALAKVKQLQGLLPICSYCKKIRDDQDYWHQVDRYVAQHADVQFSHGICPSCYEAIVLPQLNGASPRKEDHE